MKQTPMQIRQEVLIDAPNLGERIKEARKASDLTLKTLAKQAGMHPVNWYRIEEEKQVLPIDTLRKIEQVLGVDLGVEIEVVVNVKLKGKAKAGKKSTAK